MIILDLKKKSGNFALIYVTRQIFVELPVVCYFKRDYILYNTYAFEWNLPRCCHLKITKKCQKSGKALSMFAVCVVWLKVHARALWFLRMRSEGLHIIMTAKCTILNQLDYR